VERPAPGLEPGETLLVRAPASFRGATASSVRGTFALGSARQRNQAYEAWRMHAEAVGFPAAGPEMWLGLTESRLIVWKPSLVLSRPTAVTGHVPVARVADVATSRHGMVTGLAVALTSGQYVEVEAMRGRHLRRLADALRAALDTTGHKFS
jgi:hypothetical protein